MKSLIIVFLVAIIFSLKINAQTPKDIEDLIQMSLIELMNVKITTAGKTTEKVSDIPASVVIITREEIKRNGYQTLCEILENTLGMYAIDDYNVLGVDLGVRGYKSTRANENIIFLVNGVNQTNSMYNNNPLNQIIVPVEAIDRIEIVRGPMSVIYGSGAFFGAINIITNDRNKENPVNMVSASYGAYNSKKVFIRVEDSIDDLQLVFNGSIYNDDGMEIKISDLATKPQVFHDGSTRNNMARSEKYFNMSGTLDKFYFNMNYSNTRINPFVNYPLSQDAPAIITGTSATFGYKNKLSNIVSYDSKISYSTYEEEVISDYYDTTYYQHYELFKANTYEAELNTFIKPYSDLDITFGLYYRYAPDVSIRINAPSEGMPNVLGQATSNISTRSVFTQIKYQLHEKLKLVAGLRAEQKQDFDGNVVFNAGPNHWLDASKTIQEDKIELIPRMAAIYQFNDNHFLKFLYGEAIKSHSFFLSLTSLYMPGQPDLVPEQMQTFELNYIGILSPKFSTNISFFRNKLDKLITRVSGVNNEGNYYQYESNIGKMVTNGVEASINATPINDLILKLSGLYQDTEDMQNKNIIPAFSPNFLGYFQTSYSFSENIVFSFTGKYVSEMESYWDVSFIDNNPTLGQNGRIGKKMDGYFTLNSNLRIHDFFADGLFINFKISNLLDSEVRYPTTTEVNWADKGYLGRGRTFLVSIGREF